MPVPNYFDDPRHAQLREHYFEGREGGRLLAFTEDWKQKALPVNLTEKYDGQALRVDLLDTTDMKVYETWMPAAYEHDDRLPELPDDDWNFFPYHCLQDYFYTQHNCPCHRKCAAKDAGADTDEECEGNRFLILAIRASSNLGMVLFSEVLSLKNLEAVLEKHGRGPITQFEHENAKEGELP